MKLVRFGPHGAERPGVWLDNTPAPRQASILDVGAMAFDIEDYNAHFFATHGLERVRALLNEVHPKLIPAAGMRLGPPVARPGKIVCLGKNYAAHAAEFDSAIPTSPIFFSKAITSLNGPFDPIVLPCDAKRVDGEAELALVIGRITRRVSEVDAWDCIAGYTILNDVTDRDAQREGQQWFRGKSADTFCPLGPFLITHDEIPDPHGLRITQHVNGQTLQDDSTRQMLFRIPFLISFFSTTITLEPGDIIATGTPAGIGSARQPPVLLRAGDVIEVAIEQLGSQRNPVVAEP
ncbi:MAG: fumarylacetoacetate hydrolase family protein [Kiritimatiellaeota bacterium]|nr:fumarylacetoacetate hydrolase family protein [Kiritimatiellota bacterium]